VNRRVAVVLVNDPDAHWRLALTAIVEALGHRVVNDLDSGSVDVIVVEPLSRDAVAVARQALADGKIPVVCVTSGRRVISGWLLEPIAYLEKPVVVGPFVRALERALKKRGRAGARSSGPPVDA
jgi:hypothetical protein